jgi:hypothetical protein
MARGGGCGCHAILLPHKFVGWLFSVTVRPLSASIGTILASLAVGGDVGSAGLALATRDGLDPLRPRPRPSGLPAARPGTVTCRRYARERCAAVVAVAQDRPLVPSAPDAVNLTVGIDGRGPGFWLWFAVSCLWCGNGLPVYGFKFRSHVTLICDLINLWGGFLLLRAWILWIGRLPRATPHWLWRR